METSGNPGSFSILIVDDDQRMTKTLVDILAIKGFLVEAANSGEEALNKLEHKHYDCMLTDIKMPGITGVELAHQARMIRSELAIVLMTAYASERQTEQAMEEGAVAVVDKPLDLNLLLGFFSAMKKECVITIVDDDPSFCNTLGDILSRRGYRVKSICDPHQMISNFTKDAQVILLDLKLNNINGVEILQNIRKHDAKLPVILITGHKDEMAKVMEAAMKLKVFTCLYKPLQIDNLLLTITRARYQPFQQV
jgi:DNA-binding NtrC family response regulator